MPGAQPELPELLRADGHRIKRMSDTQWMALCPFHEEKTASCSVYHKGDKWRYHCHSCGAHGDAGDYLREYRNASKREAVEAVKGNGAAGPPLPAPSAPKPPLLAELPAADVRYVYRYADGTIAFAVLRFEATATRRKLFVPYTRDGDGWRKGMHLEGPRPLYRLPEMLAASRDRQIMVVEGEKCAQAVAKLSSKTVVTTWASGAQAWKHADLTPLHGRSLLLVADGDEAGHKSMRGLAEHLSPHCPHIVLVLPPVADEGEKAEDIADVIASRKKRVAEWLREHATPYERRESPPAGTQTPAAEENGAQSRTEPPRAKLGFPRAGQSALSHRRAGRCQGAARGAGRGEAPDGRGVHEARADNRARPVVAPAPRRARTEAPGRSGRQGNLELREEERWSVR